MTKPLSIVINARIQSSRTERKLVRPFADSTLLHIALEKLNRMDFAKHRFLAVAEPELIELGRQYPNVEILERKPQSVQRGWNPMMVTFRHFLEIPTRWLMVFNPCLPMIRVETIRRAVDRFQQTDFPSYTAVTETGDWIFDSVGNALTMSDPKIVNTNKDRVFYKGAHAFHFLDRDRFREQGILLAYQRNDPHMIEIPKGEAIDIDDEIEFRFAEFYYKNYAR